MLTQKETEELQRASEEFYHAVEVLNAATEKVLNLGGVPILTCYGSEKFILNEQVGAKVRITQTVWSGKFKG